MSPRSRIFATPIFWIAHAWQSSALASEAASLSTPEEFVLADLHEARNRLEEVTGARTSDDVLNAIFAKFCIGK